MSMPITITPYIPPAVLDPLHPADARSTLAPVTRQPFTIDPGSVERAVEAPSQQLVRQLQDAFAGLDDRQRRERLLDTTGYGPAELKILAHAYIAAGAMEPKTGHDPEAAAQRSVNRLTFDPSRWGDVSVLLAAIAALNLARTVGAQMQGKFAQLAYAAAIAQSNATVAAGRAEMMAAMSGAVVAIGLAVGGTVMALRAHTARHQDVKLNQGPANKLQDQLAEAHATLARPAPRLSAPDAPTPGRRSASAADSNPARSGAAEPAAPGTHEVQRQQATVDAARDTVQVREAEVAQARTDTQAVDARVVQAKDALDVAEAKLKRLEQRVDQVHVAHKYSALEQVEQARTERSLAVTQHQQASSEAKTAKGRLAEGETRLDHSRVNLAQAEYDLAEVKLQLAREQLDASSSHLARTETQVGVDEQQLRQADHRVAQAQHDVTRLEQALACEPSQRIVEGRAVANPRHAELEQQLDLARDRHVQAGAAQQQATQQLQISHDALHGAQRQLADAQQQLQAASDAVSRFASNLQQAMGNQPTAGAQRIEINERERAVLSGELRLSESQLRELQLKSRLNQRAIDKLLSYSQLLMASSTVVSAMILASVRTQAYQEQANGILHGAEMGTHKAMTEAQGQVTVENTADLGKLLEALKQVMQQTTDVMAHVASRPV